MNNPEVLAERRNNQLLNLGYKLEGPNRNIFLNGECATEYQKEQLQGSRPDYILYDENSTKPLAVIESKKPCKSLKSALDQAEFYAKKIGCDIVFATDSYIIQSKSLLSNKQLRINGKFLDFLDDFPKINILRDLCEKPFLITDEKIIEDKNNLIKLFKYSEKILRNEGIDAGIESIYEFCIILFIKIKSEAKWNSLSNESGDDLLNSYKNIIHSYRKKYPGLFGKVKIKKPTTLEKIIKKLKTINIVDTSMDIKGEAYEHFLKRYSTQNKSVLGQHFTPRHISRLLVHLLDPKYNEKIYDPFCGTGGMLIECYRYIRKGIKDELQIKHLNQNTLYGQDIGEGVSQLAKMNMILIGDGHSNITQMDTLSSPIESKYDVVITNIPFNLSKESSSTNPTNKSTNELCIDHCINALKENGRACIIIPENLCYNKKYIEFRKNIIKSINLEAIIRLPRETFKTYTSARTCILYLKKEKDITKSFSSIDIKNDGYSSGTWREPIPYNDIPVLLEHKHELKKSYKEYKEIMIKDLDKNSSFIHNKNVFDSISKDYYLLKDLVDVRSEKIKLDPEKFHYEPRLSSITNTICKKGSGRLGLNIKGNGKKVLIKPGDLVIATLHTQRGNGLFAFSDDDYIATSQLVCKVIESKISKNFLYLMLKKLLPLLETNDLVGRETYKIKDILNIRIPKQPTNFNDADYDRLKNKYKKIQLKIKEYEKKVSVL